LTAAAIWTTATWGVVTGGGGYSEPIYYDYGNTVVYEGDTVYYDSQPVATADEYYEQASGFAERGAAEVSEDDEWMSLGVWAMVQGDQTESNNILQLTVNNDGIIRGNYYNAISETTTPIEGSVHKQTQRLAFTVGDNKTTVCETGLYNLTSDEETTMLIHKGKDETQQWTLVRLEAPDDGAGESTDGA
jgi:hypothetical protein